MTQEEFLAKIGAHLRVAPWLHSLHPAVAPEELERWTRAHTGHVLPKDLVALYQITNGFSLHHIRCGMELVGEAFVVPPLRMIEPVCYAMYGQRDRHHHGLPTHWLAVGRHTDGTYHVALDPRTSIYRTIAPLVPDEAEIIGSNCREYLAWLCQFLPRDEELQSLSWGSAT